jgi:hypothetical protein
MRGYVCAQKMEMNDLKGDFVDSGDTFRAKYSDATCRIAAKATATTSNLVFIT